MNHVLTANAMSPEFALGVVALGEAHWQAKYHQAVEECEALRAKVTKLEKDYRCVEQALLSYLAKDTPAVDFTYDEWMAQIETNPTFDEFMNEIRKGR